MAFNSAAVSASNHTCDWMDSRQRRWRRRLFYVTRLKTWPSCVLFLWQGTHHLSHTRSQMLSCGEHARGTLSSLHAEDCWETWKWIKHMSKVAWCHSGCGAIANSFKISSVEGVVSRCDCRSSREASPVSAVQTDKNDLTHKQHLCWSHWSLTDQRTAWYHFKLMSMPMPMGGIGGYVL